MPSLEIAVGTKTVSVRCPDGTSIRAGLETSRHRVRSACSGIGACGLCRVRVLAGPVSALTEAELLWLDDSQREAGDRLACQARALDDLRLEIRAPAARSGWRRLEDDVLRPLAPSALGGRRCRPAGVDDPLGLAIDLGTTSLCLALTDLVSGRVVTSRWGANPQAAYGADLMSRLAAAVHVPEAAHDLQTLVIEAVREGLLDAVRSDGVDLRRIVRVVIVGNSALLALLIGHGYDHLLRPANWDQPLTCRPAGVDDWRRRWELPAAASIEIVQPLAGFVGSDLLCGLAASGLVGRPEPALYLDFGTNTEVALWNGAGLWVTSAAGGPAFESGLPGVTVPARVGAIRAVRRVDGDLSFDVIGAGHPRGLCGSGLVDLLALLCAEGVLSARGTFRHADEQSFSLTAGRRVLRIGPRQIDALQQAKAAVAVAVVALCERAGVKPGELAAVVVAGAFGRYLDIASAQAIGLLPPVPRARVAVVGNQALTGAVALLQSDEIARAVDDLRHRARLINLCRIDGFDDLFLEHLHLVPMAGGDG